MIAKTRIVEQEEFDKWLEDLKTASFIPDPQGLVLLRGTGCLACHSLDGTKLVGPSFKGFYGSQRNVTSGNTQKTVTADEAYIISAIYSPDEEIAEGYSKGLMQSYRGLLTESDINIITEYLRTLNGENL
jgi:cytochrome c oxidase subunit 2